VRDLVAAVLSLQGVTVTVASDGDAALDAAADTDAVADTRHGGRLSLS
jgi:DNA-binding response OmpR family regulator